MKNINYCPSFFFSKMIVPMNFIFGTVAYNYTSIAYQLFLHNIINKWTFVINSNFLGDVLDLLPAVFKLRNHTSLKVLLLFCICWSWYVLMLAWILGGLELRLQPVTWSLREFLSFPQCFVLWPSPDIWIFQTIQRFRPPLWCLAYSAFVLVISSGMNILSFKFNTQCSFFGVIDDSLDIQCVLFSTIS